MKKKSLLLLFSFSLVLAALVVFGRTLFPSQLRPQPHIRCEAMRPSLSFNGITYVNPSPIELAHLPSAHELGPIVGRAGNGPHDVHYNCGLLNPGDPVYRIQGYQPSFRLAVRYSNGGISFFEVGENPHARVGGDLLDIGGKVQFLTVGPIDQPERPTHTVRTLATVERLVNTILTAPVIPQTQCTFEGNEQALLFHLRDGSVVEMSYWPSITRLSTDWPQCIQVPQDFATLLAASA